MQLKHSRLLLVHLAGGPNIQYARPEFFHHADEGDGRKSKEFCVILLHIAHAFPHDLVRVLFIKAVNYSFSTCVPLYLLFKARSTFLPSPYTCENIILFIMVGQVRLPMYTVLTNFPRTYCVVVS